MNSGTDSHLQWNEILEQCTEYKTYVTRTFHVKETKNEHCVGFEVLRAGCNAM
jgi:hypothetical protein